MSDGVQPPKIEGILDIELLACRTCRRVGSFASLSSAKREPGNPALDTRGFECYTCGGRFGT